MGLLMFSRLENSLQVFFFGYDDSSRVPSIQCKISSSLRTAKNVHRKLWALNCKKLQCSPFFNTSSFTAINHISEHFLAANTSATVAIAAAAASLSNQISVDVAAAYQWKLLLQLKA